MSLFPQLLLTPLCPYYSRLDQDFFCFFLLRPLVSRYKGREDLKVNPLHSLVGTYFLHETEDLGLGH